MPVAPTLDLMAEVYRLDSRGGAGSVRFRRYTSLCETHPVHLYNPMTSKPEALETVVRLIALDAEQVVDGLVGERRFSLAVLTPGAWTDRWFTDIEHRTKALPFVGFWAGESVDAETIVSATTQQLVRLDWQQIHGPAESVASLTAQEGLALRMAGSSLAGDVERAASVYPIIHRETDHGTRIAWIHGDGAAEALGHRGLGLDAGDGLAFAVGWADRLDDPDEAIRRGLLPEG